MRTLLFLSLLALTSSLQARSLDPAAVSKVINDVRLLAPKKDARAAKVGDRIRGQTSLQTGRRSRAEILFADKTLTRVGANSIFSYRKGTRDVELKSGTILLQVPKGAGGTRIRTATVTAAITGTTLMMEYNVGHWVKLIVLEGEVKLRLNTDGRFVTVKAGQILVMDPNGQRVPKVLDLDLARLVKTSNLLKKNVFGPLPPEAKELITKAVKDQKKLLQKGRLVRTNYRPRGRGSRALKKRNVVRRDDRGGEPQQMPIPPTFPGP